MKIAGSSIALLASTALAIAACTASEPAAETVGPDASATASHAPDPVGIAVDAPLLSAEVDEAPVAASRLPRVIVHKSPSCGCCGAWVDHMREEGFAVEVRETDNLEPVKSRLGVPFGKGSCHTAEVGGYFVEGHVPASDVRRLLAERPDARGLALPGMPIGSPGMEAPDGRVQPYTVELVEKNGTTAAYARHGGAEPRTDR
jgi:hypothetical protein